METKRVGETSVPTVAASPSEPCHQEPVWMQPVPNPPSVRSGAAPASCWAQSPLFKCHLTVSLLLCIFCPVCCSPHPRQASEILLHIHSQMLLKPFSMSPRVFCVCGPAFPTGFLFSSDFSFLIFPNAQYSLQPRGPETVVLSTPVAYHILEMLCL